MSAPQGSFGCRITVSPSDADVLRVEAKKVLMFNHEEFEDFLDYVPVKQLELADVYPRRDRRHRRAGLGPRHQPTTRDLRGPAHPRPHRATPQTPRRPPRHQPRPPHRHRRQQHHQRHRHERDLRQSPQRRSPQPRLRRLHQHDRQLSHCPQRIALRAMRPTLLGVPPTVQPRAAASARPSGAPASWPPLRRSSPSAATTAPRWTTSPRRQDVEGADL